MNDLDLATDFIAELILLCEVPRKECNNVFRKLHIGAGDYMGTGYAFLDAYHKIYDEFLMKTSDSLYEMIKEKIYLKQDRE